MPEENLEQNSGSSETATQVAEPIDISAPHNPEAIEKAGTNSKNTGDEPIIRAQNLDFIYNRGKDNEFHALIDISLDIYPDEFIIVFGPSGCGKSTLLNVIAGLETPDSGTISVLGHDLTRLSGKDFAIYHRNEIGMIYQAYNLITSLSVLDNVALPQMFVNVSRGRRNRWAKNLLERFGILEHAYKIPTELSGGQQQRIGIARAIVNNPQIVLADEPVGNLDSVSAKMVLKILGELNEKEKKTVILVTHNPEYLDVADRILYMKDGIITREVVNHDKHHKKKILKPKSAANQINELMRAYQGMSPEQINILIMPYKAKVFVNHFSSNLSMDEVKIFEDILQRRLLGSISEREFYEVLDRPAKFGGVGMDRRTAQNVVDRINDVVKMAYFVYQKARQRKDENGKHPKVTFDEKADKVQSYLYRVCYDEHYKKLNEKQHERIFHAIKQRLMNTMDKRAFNDYLDTSFNQSGVGLNSKTAKAFTEELELILILGFGVVSVNQAMQKKVKQEQEKQREEEARKKAEEESRNAPSPGEILNQMQEQLGTEVRKVDEDLKKHEEQKKEIFGDALTKKESSNPENITKSQTEENTQKDTAENHNN